MDPEGFYWDAYGRQTEMTARWADTKGSPRFVPAHIREWTPWGKVFVRNPEDYRKCREIDLDRLLLEGLTNVMNPCIRPS